MKTILKVLIFYVIIVLMLVGCSQDVTTVTNAKLLVGGGPSMEHCLININEDGTVKYISCAINNGNLYADDIVREIYEEKTIHLSKKNQVIVNDFIQKIIENEPKESSSASDIINISALIENEIYHSIYYRDYSWFYNENLAKLCYTLVELAPFKVGGNDNPLEVPQN